MDHVLEFHLMKYIMKFNSFLCVLHTCPVNSKYKGKPYEVPPQKNRQNKRNLSGNFNFKNTIQPELK